MMATVIERKIRVRLGVRLVNVRRRVEAVFDETSCDKLHN
jgi:hypothetical protein